MKQDIVKKLCSFIDQSPTAFHAVEQVKEQLQEHGYKRLFEQDLWKIQPGEKYYVTRNDSSIMAFSIPKQEIEGFHVFAAHSDSPCFKIKNTPEMRVEEKYVKLNVEKYGGMILATWLDRPLSIAGRVTCRQQEHVGAKVISQKQSLQNVLVDFDENLCVIPNVAIHMNREMNQGLSYNPQIDLLPVVCIKEDKEENISLRQMVADQIGVKSEDILGSELYLYNKERACLAGTKKEMILAPRLDDLECVFSGLSGLLEASSDKYVNVLAIFHNEEVGSLTRQGADSTILKDTLFNIVEALPKKQFAVVSKQQTVAENDISKEKIFRTLVEESFMLSADNAHALHPNHGEKADPTNRPYINQGVVMKFHGGQKYATDAYSEAIVRDLADQAKVPIQVYYNRSDIAGGSTLGNIAMAQVSMPAADIGLPQWAMHSAYETAGSKDVVYLQQLAKTFFMQ